jgi:hypothetical protein
VAHDRDLAEELCAALAASLSPAAATALGGAVTQTVGSARTSDSRRLVLAYAVPLPRLLAALGRNNVLARSPALTAMLAL